MTPEYKSFFQMMSMRFIRGFIAGGFGSMAMLMSSGQVDILTNYKAWIFSFISGAVTGAVMAVDKWLRSDGTDYIS